MVVHRSSTLDRLDVVKVDGIPCTSASRTLLDLVDVISAGRLTRAIETTDRLGLLDASSLQVVIARAGGRNAAHRLQTALAAHRGEPLRTRSEFERRALALFAQVDLPVPRVNSLVDTAEGPLEVDFCWPDRRLVVEADSFEFHGDRSAFERDRRRDQLLKAAGWERIRITWRQVTQHPDQVVAAVHDD